ncbi:peptidoglycan editing factor PgeF [Neobacillus mesonae]|uniref:peptidoglycan editing factor PgeF n=1 Tax=Neobacillus mesonae TaxID=1193713 RepID=UPI00203ED4E8|nr:peptidoglycan editing factor PgeF [Neobacillus mesonae]MCM3569143.1 peptidoglycan editing factor PgeF [Neobacillus mesonae]
MEPFVKKNQSLLTIESWMKEFPGLAAGITTKSGGVSKGEFKTLNLGFHVGDIVSDVCSNRENVAKQLNFPLDHWVGAEQIHETVLKKVGAIDRGKGSDSYEQAFKGTDGFYTNEEGILLTLAFADCVPLFFIAPEKRMIGAAHAGWKGTVAQIARKMVDSWKNEGIDPKDIHVVIGPSICEKCYIVDNRVVKLIENILEDVDRKPYNLISEGQFSLDLHALNQLILIKAGIPEKQIVMSHLCTSCDQELFFSHRRDKGKTGRMLSFIGWKEISNYS